VSFILFSQFLISIRLLRKGAGIVSTTAWWNCEGWCLLLLKNRFVLNICSWGCVMVWCCYGNKGCVQLFSVAYLSVGLIHKSEILLAP